MQIHRWLDFKVTRRCNNHGNRCAYCDVPIEPPAAKELLPLEIIHRTLLDARSLGFDRFWLLGGEPSIRSDAAELLDPLRDDGMVHLTVVTNGRYRHDAMYQALFSTAAQRACIQVSMDSFEPQNTKRGDPAMLLQLITDLHHLGQRMSCPGHSCGVEVHCVITRQNQATFPDFVRFWAAKGIPVSLALVCPWTVSDAPARLNEFTRDELRLLTQRIDALRTGLPVDDFNPLVARFVRGVLSGSGPVRERRCGAGLTHLVINGDGQVYRCMADSFRPDKGLGSIQRDRLHAILRKGCGGPRLCQATSECFDGFAWDELALGNLSQAGVYP